MYDFLTSEGWWVETIITASIGAGAAIIAAIISYNFSISKIKDTALRIIEKVENVLQPGQIKISNENSNLAHDHKDILGKITKLSLDTEFLKDETLKNMNKNELALKSELKTQQVVDAINALNSEIGNLRIENAILKKENESLKQQLYPHIERGHGLGL